MKPPKGISAEVCAAALHAAQTGAVAEQARNCHSVPLGLTTSGYCTVLRYLNREYDAEPYFQETADPSAVFLRLQDLPPP